MHNPDQAWQMRNANPIAALMSGDAHLIPDHINEAVSQVPKGYRDRQRDDQRKPDAGNMFLTRIPRSRDDANAYLANLAHPYTAKEHAIRNVAATPLPPVQLLQGACVVLAVTLTAYMGLSAAAHHDAAATAEHIFDVMGVVGGSLAAYTFSILWVNLRLHKRDTHARHAPTELMEDIKTRSIDVSTLGASVATLAWDVYRYDPEHYDELVEIVQDMHDHPAERGTKTWGMYNEIIKTFHRASQIRQRETRRALNERAKTAAAYVHDEHTMLDAARADMLENTVLARVRANELAAREIYGE